MDSEDKVYIYDGDKLLAFNGEECAYNETTNVQTTYRGKTLGWTNRRVTSYNDVQLSYDGQGRRIAKGDISYVYDSQGRLLKQSNDLEFFYDHSGVSSVKHGEYTYFYRKDILGNVIALLDASGAVVVKYTYDAWGNNVVSNANNVIITDANHIGNLNPFRYRGYYYDADIKLYYLKSRYYDPETGRFISQDGVEYLDPDTINGLNLYAYCGNNPVSNVDPNGNAWWHWLVAGVAIALAVVVSVVSCGTAVPVLVGAAIGAGVSAAWNVGTQLVSNGGNFSAINWGNVGMAALGGAVAGSISAIPIPGSGVLSYLGTFATGGVASVVGGVVSGSVNNAQTALVAFGLGSFVNVSARGLSDLINKGISVSAQKSLNSYAYKDISLEDLIGIDNGIGSPVFNEFMSEAGKLATRALGSWAKSLMYAITSSSISSIISGWF